MAGPKLSCPLEQIHHNEAGCRAAAVSMGCTARWVPRPYGRDFRVDAPDGLRFVATEGHSLWLVGEDLERVDETCWGSLAKDLAEGIEHDLCWCDGCEGNGVRDHTAPCEGLDMPEGWRVVERCDYCDQKESDLAAAQLVAKVAAWRRCRFGHLHAIATNDPDNFPV